MTNGGQQADTQGAGKRRRLGRGLSGLIGDPVSIATPSITEDSQKNSSSPSTGGPAVGTTEAPHYRRGAV